MPKALGLFLRGNADWAAVQDMSPEQIREAGGLVIGQNAGRLLEKYPEGIRCHRQYLAGTACCPRMDECGA